MKDYYNILGITQNAGDEDIRKAFRKLAFQYHPDKNIGREKEAEEKFKDINEAYCVLSDKAKRQQYDLAQSGQFAGTGAPFNSPYQGFAYSREDIFRDAFNNRASAEELNRMFSQAGLRFDQEFLNRVFFNSGNVVFRVYFGSQQQPVYPGSNHPIRASDRTPVADRGARERYKPNFIERWASRTTLKLVNFALRRLFGIQTSPALDLDRYEEMAITGSEAGTGGEKEFKYRSGRKTRKLMVTIPAGIQDGTQIRLKGMGQKNGRATGDLYLRIRLSE